jgi:PPOX class F420-dependent enzyme/OxyR family protein
MPIDSEHIEYLTTHTLGRLATVGPNGAPQNKPVGYRYNPSLGTIDIAGFDMERSAKYRNVGAHPDVAFVVDDSVGEGAEGVRFVELRGRAEHAVDPDRGSAGTGGGVSDRIIRIHPRRLLSWNIRSGHTGMHAEDLETGDPGSADAQATGRPALAATGAADEAAQAAVARLVDELQEGYDQRDADISNRHFAADLIWGSPFGATITSYDELHAIHVRLKERGVGGPASRYEVVQALSPAPGVAVAHVRRVAFDADGNPGPEGGASDAGFSEMALYVLVRHGGSWWLAAGQNTPIRLSEAPSRT